MKTIKHIFDGDFGCEESCGKKATVSVTLIDETGEESYVTIEDEWLQKQGLDVGSEWPEYLIRICEMEAILDSANYLIANNAAGLEDFRSEIEKLEAYYTSQEWKDDFALDEAGELPDGLKRGVLSEDGIYDVLEKYRELIYNSSIDSYIQVNELEETTNMCYAWESSMDEARGEGQDLLMDIFAWLKASGRLDEAIAVMDKENVELRNKLFEEFEASKVK